MFGLFTPRVDQKCVLAGGKCAGAVLTASLDEGCDYFELSREEFAETVRRSTDCQLIIVAITSAVGNYALQDAYHDAGLASPLGGMPKFKFDVGTDGRAMAREAWSGFPACKADLDMRYRYVFTNKLLSAAEAALWERCESWAETAARAFFELKRDFSPNWVGFVAAIRTGEVARAKEILLDLSI